jgi:hypothetical protein
VTKDKTTKIDPVPQIFSQKQLSHAVSRSLSSNAIGHFGVGQKVVFFDQLVQRHQFFLLDQAEFLDKKSKMFERCVEMCLLPQGNHVLEMLVVNVGVNAEQTFQQSPRIAEKILGKRYTDFRGEHRFVI